MITAYFWVDGKCVEHSGSTSTQCIENVGLNNYPCVDITCVGPAQRYGIYTSGGWEPIPYADMPKELLAHVLLLT